MNVGADSDSEVASAAAEWTVRKVLDWTTQHLKKHGSETPRLDAEILLAHARDCQRIQLYTHYNEPVTEPQRTMMRELVRRRAQAEPVAYLVGHREFFGLSFRVTPAVLVPRPETETLVLELLALAKPIPHPSVLDIGTGSGCLAIAAAMHLPSAVVTAIDISPAALEVARGNAARHNLDGRVKFAEGDLFSPLDSGARFHFIVSNPPYVADSEMDTLPADVRRHEPALALQAGPDGLDVIRRIVTAAPVRLQPGGWLLLEFSPEQSAGVQELLRSSGALGPPQIIKDASGHARVAKARLS